MAELSEEQQKTLGEVLVVGSVRRLFEQGYTDDQIADLVAQAKKEAKKAKKK